jgi:hypothetical protein
MDPLAVAGDASWAGHEGSPALSVLDRTSGLRMWVTPPKVAGHTTGSAVVGSEPWVASSDGALARVRSPEEMTAEVIAPSLRAVAAAFGMIWAASEGARAPEVPDQAGSAACRRA